MSANTHTMPIPSSPGPCAGPSAAGAVFASITLCHKYWQSLMAYALSVGNASDGGRVNLLPESPGTSNFCAISVRLKTESQEPCILGSGQRSLQWL